MEVKDIIKEDRNKIVPSYEYRDYYREDGSQHHRQPTFSDAIEETRKQMIEKAIEWIRSNIRPYYSDVKYKYDDFKKAMEE